MQAEEIPLPETAEGANGISVDATGAVLMTLDATWSLLRYDPASRAFDTIPLGPRPAGATSLAAITRGPDGAYWTASSVAAYRINLTSASVESYPLPAGLEDPVAIAAMPNETLWLVSPSKDIMVRLEAGTGDARARRITAERFGPTDLAAQGDEILLVGSKAGTFVRFDPATGEETSGPTGILRAPSSLHPVPGHAWVAEAGSSSVAWLNLTYGRVTRYPAQAGPNGTPSALSDVCRAADGTVWFIERDARRIGRLDTMGSTVMEIQRPDDPDWAPRHLAAASDGSIWYTLEDRNVLGRIPARTWPAPATLEPVVSTYGTSVEIPAPMASQFRIAFDDGRLGVQKVAADKIVVERGIAPPGIYKALLSRQEGQDGDLLVGKYVLVVFEKGEASTGSLPPLAVLAALCGLAILRRVRYVS